MTSIEQLLRTADLALDRGQPSLFKRMRRVAMVLAEKEDRSDYLDTDTLLNETIEDEREDEPPSEEIEEEPDPDGDGDLGPEADDRDNNAYTFFPVEALGTNTRTRGIRPDQMEGKKDPALWFKKR